MIIKIIKATLAYVFVVALTSAAMVLTFYLPQMGIDKPEITNQFVLRVINGFTIGIIFYSSPITLFLGLFAYFKKITSPTFYMVMALFSIMLTLAFTPIFQGIEGYEGYWVPFVAFIAAVIAGYLFWFLAIRQPPKKIQTI